ncbi:hypothetical protein ACQZ6J_21270 [Rhizobium sp. A37_96]
MKIIESGKNPARVKAEIKRRCAACALPVADIPSEISAGNGRYVCSDPE